MNASSNGLTFSRRLHNAEPLADFTRANHTRMDAMREALVPTPEARRYAVKELARRAGVSQDFYLTWNVNVSSTKTTVAFGPDGSKKIHFERAHNSLLEKISKGEFPVARVSCPELLGKENPAGDVVIPFCEPNAQPSAPLFERSSNSEIVCHLDLLLSLLLTMTRAEETFPVTRDEHGRFPAAESLAARHDFLERPIVDEWCLALEREIAALLPGWAPQRREMRIKLTHDVDQVGMPFQFSSLIGHAWFRRNACAALRGLAATVANIEPEELRLVRRLAAISKARKFHSAFYWKASPPGPRDSGYDPLHPKVQSVIRALMDEGFEVGVHPGYETFGSRQNLSCEVNRLRKALGVRCLGGRQHYLRWSPDSWLDWEACELAYDTSVGFADRVGFRAGTCFPFRPWSLVQNRELDIMEIPLIVMDCTPVKYMPRYMGLSKSQSLERVRGCIRRIARVGGVFTLLWHNVPLMEPEYDGWYETILDLLEENRSYEHPSRAALLW